MKNERIEWKKITQKRVIESLRDWYDKDYLDDFFVISWYMLHFMACRDEFQYGNVTSYHSLFNIYTRYLKILKKGEGLTLEERRYKEFYEICFKDESIVGAYDFFGKFDLYYSLDEREEMNLSPMDKIEMTINWERKLKRDNVSKKRGKENVFR